MDGPEGVVAEEIPGVEGLGFDLDQRRLVDRVYEQMKQAIQEGRIRPGQRLVQDVLARQFGISRSPVREAIIRLAQEGFVQLEPHRGAVVWRMTDREMDQIYEVRLVLEPYAAAKAARLAGPDDIDRVVRVQREAEERRDSMDLGDLFRVNGEFHRVLIGPCGNVVLVSTLNALWERQVSFRMFALYTGLQGALDGMLREHRAILEAYRARQADRVRALVEEHVRAARALTADAGRRKQVAERG